MQNANAGAPGRAVPLALVVCLGLAACSGPGTGVMTLEELIRRHTEARGGQVAIEGIQNLEMKLRIVEPTYMADGVYRADRKGRMRIDVFMEGKRVFTEAFDGKRAWQLSGGEERAVEAGSDGSAALRHSGQFPTNILGLHEMAAHGHTLEYAGREDVAGVAYHVVVLTLDDGFTTRYYIDPTSYLIARGRVRKALHPDVDPAPTTIETVWTDFRDVGGVRFAFQGSDTDLATGRLLQTTTLLDITPNAPLDEALFRMP
jgi:hypothetical protein